jgi:glyoxylase-like metal-dependent hydrolase (beta-lactamase superfamily II)
MASANEIFQVKPSLYFWQVYEPSVKCDLSSHAYRSRAGLVLFDPAPLTTAALKELKSYGPPVAIILTNANHERAALFYRKHFEIPIIAAPESKPGLTLLPDVFIQFEESIYGLRPVSLAGSVAGETAFLAPEGILFVGDSLIHLHKGLELLPDKYCTDPRLNRESLRKLTNLSFDTIAFAHGTPLLSHAREKLRQLVGT